MIEKSIEDLNFRSPGNPIPTIEIDLDSIPEELIGYSALVTQALQSIATDAPEMIASIYSYHGPSVNFGRSTWSAFIGVADNTNILTTFLAYFKKAGVIARYGDYISIQESNCEFHVQNGRVWEPLDAVTWYSETEEDTLTEDQDQMLSCQESNSESIKDENGPKSTPRISNPTRFRAARANASVGVIRRRIEEVFGLPEGCVALCDPEGRSLRADALISTLRKRWE